MVADKFNLFGWEALFEKSMNIFFTSSVANKKLHCVAPVFGIFDAYFFYSATKKALKNYHNSIEGLFSVIISSAFIRNLPSQSCFERFENPKIDDGTCTICF